MGVGLDVPERVGHGGILVARNLLLSKTPIWQSDLVGEEIASGQSVSQAEVSAQRTNSSRRETVGLVTLYNLDMEVVVGITAKALKAICSHFILVVAFGDGRTVCVVTVKTLVGSGVDETNLDAVCEVADGVLVEACDLVLRSQRVTLVVQLGGGIFGSWSFDNDPDIVVVQVRVEGDLLLLTSSRVGGLVGVQVATLSVEMLDCDGRAESDVRKSVGHSVSVKGVLEGAAHEGVAFTAAPKKAEMDGESAEVDKKGQADETNGTSRKVANDSAHWLSDISEMLPELSNDRDADGCNSQETDPFGACNGTQAETCERKKSPPCWRERSTFLLVAKGNPEVDGECSEEDKDRVEQDESALCGESIVEEDKDGAQGCCRGSQRKTTKGKVGERNSCDTKKRVDCSHHEIWYGSVLAMEILSTDILKVEITVEAC